jgi:hypothetical protein
MIGVNWIAGLPTTQGDFDMIQNHVDLLSGKVHAVYARGASPRAFRALVKSMGSSLIVGSAYHKNTNVGDTLLPFCSKDDWDRQLTLTVFAINNAASTLGDRLTPFFINRGPHPRLLLSVLHTQAGDSGESPAHFALRMRELEDVARALGGGAAGAQGEAGLRRGSTLCSRWGNGCCCGPRSHSTRPASASCCPGPL